MSQAPPRLAPEDIEELAQSLAKDDTLSEKIAGNLVEDDNFTNRTLIPQLVPKLRSELAKQEKRAPIWWSLGLATVSFLTMFVVYWLSLSLGGTNAVNPFVVSILGSAFYVVILVINIAFYMIVFKVTR